MDILGLLASVGEKGIFFGVTVLSGYLIWLGKRAVDQKRDHDVLHTVVKIFGGDFGEFKDDFKAFQKDMREFQLEMAGKKV